MAWELDSDRPIYIQLVERIQMEIVSGYYPPGGKLPSVRELAAEAAVNPNTMQKAFAELIQEAYGYQRVPSGDAWNIVRTEYDYNYLCTRLGNEENWGDGYHDGNIGGGQYLNACVWFEMITGQSVVGNTYAPAYKNGVIASTITDKLQVTHDGTYYTLNPEFITILQTAAHQAVAELNAE